jgi:predicted permease
VFFTPCFYTWGFWTAARYGTPVGPTAMSGAFGDELRLYPFLSMAAGAALSLGGVPRPGLFETVNQLLIPVTTALYLAAIGSQLRFESPRPHLRPCLAMCAIKFVYSPLLAWIALSVLDIRGMAREVVLLLSLTPVGVSPLVLPLLFGLDRPLANALWLVTTVVSVPLFLFIVPWVA